MVGGSEKSLPAGMRKGEIGVADTEGRLPRARLGLAAMEGTLTETKLLGSAAAEGPLPLCTPSAPTQERLWYFWAYVSCNQPNFQEKMQK